MADGHDFIREIKIAQYWRKHLGDFEYLRFNPDDLKRWYAALELRGPLDIRDFLIERNGRHVSGTVTGIVGVAPHPPREVVQIWLESHTTKIRTGHYWLAVVAFALFSVVVGPHLQGCSNLKQLSRFDLNPPRGQQLPFQTGAPPLPGATNPTPLPAPPAGASRSSGPAK